MLTEIVAAPRAWYGPALTSDRYLVPIPGACLREIDAVVAELRRAPVPTLLLDPAQFTLDACARLMATVRNHLDEGTGVVVLDRLPLDHLSAMEAVDVYWLLANFLEPPVAQEWKGTVIYDVRHDGGAYGADTRGALTPVSLEMHTDSSMGEAPPNYLGLLCLETAKSGGMSIVSSALAAHNHFLDTAPHLLERLYQRAPHLPWLREDRPGARRGRRRGGAPHGRLPPGSRPSARPLARARPDPVPQQSPRGPRPHHLRGPRRSRAASPPRAPLAPLRRPPPLPRLSRGPEAAGRGSSPTRGRQAD